MSDEDEQKGKRAKECYICGKSYTQKDIRVRDHCHVTGKYRGSAHQDGNDNHFRFKDDEIKIPVIFHNLKGYDNHFIMQGIGEIAKNIHTGIKKGEDKNRWTLILFQTIWKNKRLLCWARI